MKTERQRKAAHNAARLLQNLAYTRISRAYKMECEQVAHEIYQAFGEPEQPITSAGGNYFEIGREVRTEPSIKFRQFLTDVITTAGLVAHGKQDKKLAERLASEAIRFMAGT